MVSFLPADGTSTRSTWIYVQGNGGPVIIVHYVHSICGWKISFELVEVFLKFFKGTAPTAGHAMRVSSMQFMTNLARGGGQHWAMKKIWQRSLHRSCMFDASFYFQDDTCVHTSVNLGCGVVMVISKVLNCRPSPTMHCEGGWKSLAAAAIGMWWPVTSLEVARKTLPQCCSSHIVGGWQLQKQPCHVFA